MNKADGTSMDLERMNANKIKELFPQVVSEGKIDFDLLKTMLGSNIDENAEKYQFTWNGKKNAIKLAQTPSTATLIPSISDSQCWDKTDNLYIEGDNLEVLKLLQKTYYGKIQMIYIDPPYNTGGDFVYKDDFVDSIKNYKIQTQQISKANPETNGRYHTDWLNMMYSRLLLSKNLLTIDGVIFISIDDNEVDNLKKICLEIFGENSFVATAVRKRRDSQANLSKNISPIHEYVLIFSKSGGEVLNRKRANLDENGYKNPDNDPRGSYVTMPCTNKGGQIYEIVTPTGKTYKDEWRFKKETYMKLFDDNRIVFPKQGDGKPRYKIFMNEKQENGVIPNTWWDFLPTNQEATREIESLFDCIVFDTPKPIGLIEFCVELATNKESIILDFFSGSSTTACAVIHANLVDGGNRKFIMVQLPELIAPTEVAYNLGFRTISEIGRERIRKYGNSIEHLSGNNKNQSLFEIAPFEKTEIDLGFKCFKQDSSNIIPWDGSKKLDETSLFAQTEVIKVDRSKKDVLYEIMLKYGVFDKSVSIILVNDKPAYSIGSGYLVVFLENRITMEDVKKIGGIKPKHVIFLESGFLDDNEKINTIYTLTKMGVDEIQCI